MRTRIILSITALLVIVGATVAFAAIPHSATGVITGCRHNSTGALRVIDAEAGATCAGNETQLTWNQTGPAGPQSLTELFRVQGSQGPLLQPNESATVRARCPDGKAVISGGYSSLQVPVIIERSIPDRVSVSVDTGEWVIIAKNVGDVSQSAPTPWALCGNADWATPWTTGL
jgi:hypothetical protein